MSNIDHEVNRFLDSMVGHISRPLLTLGQVTLDKLLNQRPNLKVDIKSPHAGIDDDVRRIQDLRAIGLIDSEIRPHILESATAKDSHNIEKYADTAFDRATLLTKRQEYSQGKEKKKEIGKSKQKEKEMSL